MANTLKYTDGTGPAFVDGTTGFTATINVQSLGASRAYTLPDVTGTLSVLGNTSTGTGSVVLATSPTIATPTISAPTLTGTVTASTGDIKVGTAGKGLFVKEGSNAKQGTATLVTGAATVSNTSVTANSRIFLSGGPLNLSTAIGELSVTTITASTSFVITSYIPGGVLTQTGDLRTIYYEIFEPA
jgi:hypothetical protein